MATIKSYSDLQQSKKLAQILPIESADMYYDRYGTPNFIDNFVTHESIKNDKYHRLIPCWSLASLLGVLPNKIVSHETAFEEEDAEDISDTYYKHIELTENGRYMCCYVGNGYKYKCVADNPVDACVAMIEKLHELNL